MKFQVNLTGERFKNRYALVISATNKEQARKRAIRQLTGQFPAEHEFTTENVYPVPDSQRLGFVC